MPTTIDHNELRKLTAEGAQLVEVLPPAEYAELHLPGAINLPLKELNADSARRLDSLQKVRERVRSAGWDTCIVVNEHRIVLGRLGRAAFARDDDVRVAEAMNEGPSTIRPDTALETIVRRLRDKKLSTALVTTLEGELVGVLRLEDAERVLGST